INRTDADPARLFRTLGDPSRLRLLRLLAWEELNVAEICRVVGLPQPTVSRQLALLKESGLVADRKSGPWVFHRLAVDAAPAMTRNVIGAVRPTLDEASPEADRDRTRLDRVLRERQETARLYYASGTESAGTRQSRFGDATAWRTLAGLLPRQGTIVDLGTGAGDLLPQLSPRAGRVVALDFSEAMLSHARARAKALRLPNVAFVRGELEAVPLPNASADGVVASLVLHHAARPEAAIREMARLLAPGGRAVVVDFLPHREDWLKDEEGDVWPGFDPKALHGWFARAGFSDILIEEGPAPVSSGRRDRPGSDRRLKNLRLQWVEAVRAGEPAAPARTPRQPNSKRVSRTTTNRR
ncbi:MAG TPA: metalloregulator ArsR/SmtB family transcription factor, partial [Candidatus Eisenbacteria bacterium]